MDVHEVGLPYTDELLVDLVQGRENLFDKGRVDYKDEQARAEAWEAIASTFGMKVEECQTRWVRLRERFGRELRLNKRGMPPGKEWPLFTRMRWLERFIQPRNRVGGSKAHVAALHAALVRERSLGSLGFGGLGASASSRASGASDSGDGVGVGGEEPTMTSASAGPLWPHTFKMWASSDHHLNHNSIEDDDSQQDMAVDLATHTSHPSTPPQAGSPPSPEDYHHRLTDAASIPGMLPGPMSSPPQEEIDFQDSVRQSLSTMAGSLDGIERLLSRPHEAQQDPDELFARSLAATLRRLPRAQRSQAKMKLIAVLAEYEDGP